MKIIIESQNPKLMRYATVGDYVWEDGTLHITVADMGNENYNYLVALHELVESWLCQQRGIKEEDISTFDIQYEKEREEGKHTISDEPGFDENAPYRKEHTIATGIEIIMAEQLGIN